MSLQDHFEQIAKQETERRAMQIEQALRSGVRIGLSMALDVIADIHHPDDITIDDYQTLFIEKYNAITGENIEKL